jgi:hypothetical protein
MNARRFPHRVAAFFVGLAGWLGLAITLTLTGIVAAGGWKPT